jgi:hypothetical protein
VELVVPSAQPVLVYPDVWVVVPAADAVLSVELSAA